MQHCDAETLSLWALGQSPAGDAPEEAHLVTCARCRSELDQLRAVVGTARSLAPEDVPGPVSRSVWDSIASTLALADRSIPAGAAVTSVKDDVAVTHVKDTERLAEVVPLRRRAAAPWLLTAAAAVVGLLAGAVIVQVATRPAAPVVLASAVLDPLSVAQASGTAELDKVDGTRTLRVDVTGLPATDGFYEVWLLDESASKLVSLGTLGAGDSGEFVVPSDLVVAEFPVVDVSREPLDGNPAHSKDSVVRGTLSV